MVKEVNDDIKIKLKRDFAMVTFKAVENNQPIYGVSRYSMCSYVLIQIVLKLQKCAN